jgi:hypothetical protein
MAGYQDDEGGDKEGGERRMKLFQGRRQQDVGEFIEERECSLNRVIKNRVITELSNSHEDPSFLFPAYLFRICRLYVFGHLP